MANNMANGLSSKNAVLVFATALIAAGTNYLQAAINPVTQGLPWTSASTAGIIAGAVFILVGLGTIALREQLKTSGNPTVTALWAKLEEHLTPEQAEAAVAFLKEHVEKKLAPAAPPAPPSG